MGSNKGNKMNTISALPPTRETAPVQASIDASLVEAVHKERKKHGVKMNQVVAWGLQQWLIAVQKIEDQNVKGSKR